MRREILCLIVLLCFVNACYGVFLSTLPKNIVVNASAQPGQVLKAGKDKITVTWKLVENLPDGADAQYSSIKIKLCYAPVSQKDRKWRKSSDNLEKDKGCPNNVASMAYSSSNGTTMGSVDWLIPEEVPTATYFVRAYAVNANGTQLAYGQTTNAEKSSSLFMVEGISGRTVGVNVASGAFSAFSILILAFMHTKEYISKSRR